MSLSVSGNYYGTGSGNDSYSGKFIPAIWSGMLQKKFYASTCMTEICNSDWSGEIKDQGDKVEIRTIPDITIRDYQKGQTLVSDVPASGMIELLIDQGKYFQFVIDDVDDVQSDLRLMDMFSHDASMRIKIGIEQNVFAGIVTKLLASTAATTNAGNSAGVKSANLSLGTAGTPVILTKSNILDSLVDMSQALDEQNVAGDGRWAVIPPWVAANVKKSDLKDASLSGDGTSLLRTGRLGEIAGLTLYVNNNLQITSSDGSYSNVAHILAGTKDAVCFASQFTKMETLRSTSTFGNIIRGLQVFGYQVTKPEALLRLYAVKG